MDYDTILLETSEKMDHCVEHFQGELRGLRSGRASPALVDSIKVEYYGSPTPLGQVVDEQQRCADENRHARERA